MNLKDRQQAEYDRLMKMKARQWPGGLQSLYVKHCLRMDDFTEAARSAVREWVQREVKLPVSNFAKRKRENTKGEKWEASTRPGAPGSRART